MIVYRSERLFHILNGLLFIFVNILMVAPMIHILALSFSSHEFVMLNEVYLWPKGFNLHVYKEIYEQPNLWRAMGVTVYITVMGTIVYLFLTTTLAYSLSRSGMPARKLILKGIIVPLFFPYRSFLSIWS